MNPLVPFFAFLARKRSERALAAAERKRSAILAQQQYRKAKHRAWKYLEGELMQATNASLRASVSRHLPKQEVR